MPTVTGILRDFTFAPMTPAKWAPELVFIPSAPAVGGTSLFSTEPPKAVIDQYGNWTVELMNYESTRPHVSYTPQLKWLDAAGGYIKVDYFDMLLLVPAAGGFFTDLVSTDGNPLIVWWSDTEPPTPTINTYWVNTNTGDVKKWN